MTRSAELTDQVDGERTVFTLPETIVPATLDLYLNGVRQQRGEAFRELDATRFSTAAPPRQGDVIVAQYQVVGEGDTIVFPLVAASGFRPRL